MRFGDVREAPAGHVRPVGRARGSDAGGCRCGDRALKVFWWWSSAITRNSRGPAGSSTRYPSMLLFLHLCNSVLGTGRRSVLVPI